MRVEERIGPAAMDEIRTAGFLVVHRDYYRVLVEAYRRESQREAVT